MPLISPNKPYKFSSLTFSELARISESPDERSAWDVCADIQIENESLTDRLWQLEADRNEVLSLLKRVSDELDNMRNGLCVDSVVETGLLYCEKLAQKAELILGKEEPKGTH